MIPLFEIQYFPSIHFFILALHSDRVLLEQHENYQKRGLRNKCKILASHGSEVLSIPLLKGKNEQQPIKEVKIANDQAWTKQHWNSLQTAYGKSAFFLHYADKLKPILDKQHSFLFDLNIELIDCIFKILRIDSNIEFTDYYQKKYGLPVIDIRNQTDLIISGLHPMLQVETKSYLQVFSDRLEFIDNLSILDLLFCMGPESLRVLNQAKILYNQEHL